MKDFFIGIGGFLKNLLTVAFALCLILVALEFCIPIFECSYTNDSSASSYTDSGDWMKSVDGSLLLNQISIPGTHDSAANHAWLGFFSDCQALSIKKQLEAGYRYLDIRLAVSKNRLKFMHGFTDCRQTFAPWSSTLYLDDVLPDIYAFLDKHPSETIIFNVKKEHGNESIADFENLLNTYVAGNPDYWYLSSELPSLDQARGKIILARRYEDQAGLGESSGLALIWQDQRGSEVRDEACELFESGGLTLYIQDYFEYSLAEKWKAFYGLFTTNPAKDNENAVMINFLSTKGTLSYGHPFYYAYSLNQKLLKQEKNADTNTGWVILDYATAKGARAIYVNN